MSRQCGLKNVHIALLLTDTEVATTYATPTKIAGAIKATIKPSSTQTLLRSDDSVEETVNFFEKVDVTIELSQLDVTTRAILQGATVVKGVLIEKKTDIPPVVAFGFESKKSNGEVRYVWLYKGTFSLGDDNFETEADKFKDQTNSLSATFYARNFDGAYKLMVDSDEPLVEPAFITAFFTTVCDQPSAV